MSNINLLDSLIENDSIKLNQTASDWKEAIKVSLKPLVESKAVEPRYIDAVINSTIKNGPYYIIADNIAMPHSQSGDGALKNAFSLIILQEPVLFEKDDRKISVLIALSATSADIHVAVALPQIVAVFEDPQTVEKILKSQSKEEIINIIKSIDLKKYLKDV